MVGYFLLTITWIHRGTMGFQTRLFLWALAVRFIFAVVVYQFGLVSVLGDEDATGWSAGVQFYREWEQKGVGLVELPAVLTGACEGQHRGCSLLTGTLFLFTGTPARMPAAALNCLFGAMTVVFAYRMARSIFSSWVAERAGWFACFFPSLIIWSAQTLKEPVVIFLETVALYGCVQLKKSGFSL